MEDLIDWLKVQLDARERELDEDERVARKASEVCGCCPPARGWLFADDDDGGRIATVDDPHPAVRRQLGRRWNKTYGDMFTARHIVRWDPARVLRKVADGRAEVAAKRRILDEFSWEGGETNAVMLLAQPYASKPGFRPEWRL